MKSAYEWFEEMDEDKDFKYSIPIKWDRKKEIYIATDTDTMLLAVEGDVLELALDVKGLASIWLSSEGMVDVIKEINKKWNEISDLFFEYRNIDIPKDMVKKHLEGSDEKRCKRLIGGVKRRVNRKRTEES